MRSSGQGGNKHPRFSIAAKGESQSLGGKHVQGNRMASRFSMKENPTASARPRAWLAIPGFPSWSTHASGRKASVAARKAGHATVKEEAICFVYENDPGTAREWEPGATKLLAEAPMIRQFRECYRMRRIRLDRIDRRILRNLLADGRMTNVQLATRVGISAPPCLRRVRALEEAGIIRGYHADLAREALGYGVTVFAEVGLSSQAEPDLKAFEELVPTWPEVREA
jgi:hypothetical protein